MSVLFPLAGVIACSNSPQRRMARALTLVAKFNNDSSSAIWESFPVDFSKWELVPYLKRILQKV
jgi:hypothetical protein